MQYKEYNDFEYYIEDDHVVIDHYVGNEKDVTISFIIGNYSVTSENRP